MITTTAKTIVVVLGMHRSGTSAMTRALQLFGVELGDHLMPPSYDNEKGFWEDLDFYELNVSILEYLGADYQTIEPVFPDLINNTDLSLYTSRAVALLQQKMSNVSCFGLKDPRFARLLPFWKPVFDALHLRVNYVIALRNPMSIVRSMAKREGFSYEKSYLLWYEYTLHSLTQTVGEERVVVDYDRLIQDPLYALGRIATTLNLPFNPQDEAVARYQLEFIDTTLRHTYYLSEDLYLESGEYSDGEDEIHALFELASQLAIDQMDVNSREYMLMLQQHNERLKSKKMIFRYLRQTEKGFVE
ncbi:MAG TPA: hypothetical protein DDY37_03670 [Legionella sp.]|nr:hypothetical protein [Legionella sp.]